MDKESPSVIEMIAQWSQMTYRLKVSRSIMDSHQPLEIPILGQFFLSWYSSNIYCVLWVANFPVSETIFIVYQEGYFWMEHPHLYPHPITKGWIESTCPLD